MSSIDLDDDLIVFTIDSFDDDECYSRSRSDLLINDNTPVDRINTTSTVKSSNTKMSDIIDLIDSTELNDKQESFDLISQNVSDCLRTHGLKTEQSNYEKSKWETEEQYLKYGSKQLSPSDYLTRTSLYNRPVAFEKDSRVWARSLLDNFKKSNHTTKSKSSSPSSSLVNFTYYLPIVKKSSSFDRHVQYIEHLNECNDYPAYLEYLRENRSELLYTLTDSIDIIDGLIGTVV